LYETTGKKQLAIKRLILNGEETLLVIKR